MYSPKVPASRIRETYRIRHPRNRERIGSFGGRGGRVMISFSGGSKASDKARVTAVIMLIHRICTAVMGSAMPARSARTMVIASPALVGRVQLITFLMLS